MSLDTSKLENVHGKVIARCPACAEGGHDQKGEHLVINADGSFGCVLYPGDSADAKAHRKRIFALCGDRTTKPLAVSPISHDRDAAWGRGARGMQKGYKLRERILRPTMVKVGKA